MINNACATQAVIAVLVNSSSKVDIGEVLRNLENMPGDASPLVKGLTISNDAAIREAHNSVAPATVTLEPETGDDAEHFTALVPVQGAVFELDGLRGGPVKLGDVGEDEEEWVRMVRIPDTCFKILAVIESVEAALTVEERETRRKDLYASTLTIVTILFFPLLR